MSNRIRQLRKKNGLKQEELMPILNVGRSQVSKLETGSCPLTEDVIIKLCNYFRVSADYLLCHDTDYDSPDPEPLSELEQKILSRFKRASRTNKEIILKILQINEIMLDANISSSNKVSKKEVGSRLMDQESKVAAGE